MASRGSQAVMLRLNPRLTPLPVIAGLASNVPGLIAPRQTPWAAFVADGDGPHSMRLASITFFGQLR